MELRIFSYIEDVLKILDMYRDELERAGEEISRYFENMLEESNEGYLNISERVKSDLSLKEKIIRNSYYKRYSPHELFDNLSDLIGVRIECRFIEDENEIYKALKKHFNKLGPDGLSYSPDNEKIRIDLSGKQPQKQKNGFKIYKIDGKYITGNRCINFELQIKSLVNMFWGEIEHRIIYKNYNYLTGNKFLSEIMGSIKNNLAMIDNQLNIMYNQINKMNSAENDRRKQQIETLLSSLIYDVYSTRMNEDIGFIVDFRKSCDTIMRYILRRSGAEEIEDYKHTLVKVFERLNSISSNPINFDSEINIEREIEFTDNFTKIVGNTILKSLNTDFHWNLFFKILFEIELGNNAQDFEAFLAFLRNRFYQNESFISLRDKFKEEEAEEVIETLIGQVALCFERVDTIEFIYDYNIEKINSMIEDLVDSIFSNISSFEEWECVKDIYSRVLSMKIFSLFSSEVKTSDVKRLMEAIKSSPCGISLSSDILRYIGKMEGKEEIRAEEIANLFRV